MKTYVILSKIYLKYAKTTFFQRMQVIFYNRFILKFKKQVIHTNSINLTYVNSKSTESVAPIDQWVRGVTGGISSYIKENMNRRNLLGSNLRNDPWIIIINHINIKQTNLHVKWALVLNLLHVFHACQCFYTSRSHHTPKHNCTICCILIVMLYLQQKVFFTRS